MQCPRCRHENRSGAKFCEECTAPLVQVCQKCGTQLALAAKFCSQCAHPTGLAASEEARFASPHSYTPKHLAERILTSKAALEGERKLVTVLFADMKGSMELLVDRDPEEARRILDPVLERMMEAVHRYEGTVNQVMGDGIMALFGAPLGHEDHAVRACYAALRAQEAVTQYAAQLRRTHNLDAQIRVGLNSGEVVVRSIGSDLRMDYTAVGETTHLAARIEQLARPGTILLSSETLRLAEDYIEVNPLGPVSVKGLTKPIEIYELRRVRPLRFRLQAVAARGLTEFVGRESELSQLGRALEQAQAGHGQVVAVVGEPGVGKSRLLWEFTHSREKAGWLSLECGSVSYGKTTAYLPILDLLKGYFDIQDRDDPRNIREKVTSRLALDRALGPILPALLALLDVPVEDVLWQGLDPPQRRQRTQDAVKRLLLRESDVQPVLVVIEDLQWADSETLALLDGLVEALPTVRLLLVVSYRQDYRHTWANKTYYTQLPVEPLSIESAQALLQALLGDDPRLQPLRELLIERTEGNPFFMEETVRTLAETHVLVGERGAYHLARSADTIQVPATVQAVLASRIDRLHDDNKRLLQTASVIGKDVPLALLQGIAELPDETLSRSLVDLRKAEFLYERRLFPQTEFTFKHALTHAVAYSSLLRPRRRALHARIVGVMEELYAERLTEHVDRLAHHALRGEIWDKALTYLRQAGEKALTRSAYREAAAWFEQALVTLNHVPKTSETQAHAIDLRFDLRNSLLALGEHERILDYLREAEILAEGLGDRRRTARSLCYKTTYFWNAGEPELAIESGHRALATAAEISDVPLEVVSNIGLSWAYHALGDYHRAIGFLRSSLASLEGDLVREGFGLAGLPAVVSRTWLAWCLAARGEFVESLARAEEGVRIAQSVDHPYSLAIAYFGLGFTRLHKGELPEAVPLLTRGLELSRTFNIRPWFTALASALGYAYALSGRAAEALPLLAESVEVAAAMRSRFRQSQRVAWLSEALFLAGRREEAIPLAFQALELARRHKERGYEAHALRLLGEIGRHCDLQSPTSPDDYYREALALASELEMRPLIAHCRLGLGQLSQRVGIRGQAEDHLKTAAELFREMDMRLWQDQSEAALSALS